MFARLLMPLMLEFSPVDTSLFQARVEARPPALSLTEATLMVWSRFAACSPNASKARLGLGVRLCEDSTYPDTHGKATLPQLPGEGPSSQLLQP